MRARMKSFSRMKFFAYALLCFLTAMPYGANAREMTEYPRIRLQSLDKATARTMTFDAKVGNTLKFGPLYIRVKTCKKSSPVDEPESAAFLQVWEVDSKESAEWVFSGWMFASSPGLSPMDHPIYDVWVLECLGPKEVKPENIPVVEDESDEEDFSLNDEILDEDPED